MTNSEKDEIIASCETAAYYAGDADHVTVCFERKTLESLVSLLERTQILRCSNIIMDEDFVHYPREELENIIKKEVGYCLAAQLIESNAITYSTEKDRHRQQTKITATLNIIKPEVEK